MRGFPDEGTTEESGGVCIVVVVIVVVGVIVVDVIGAIVVGGDCSGDEVDSSFSSLVDKKNGNEMKMK